MRFKDLQVGDNFYLLYTDKDKHKIIIDTLKLYETPYQTTFGGITEECTILPCKVVSDDNKREDLIVSNDNQPYSRLPTGRMLYINLDEAKKYMKFLYDEIITDLENELCEWKDNMLRIEEVNVRKY